MSRALTINIAMDFLTEGKLTADVHAIKEGKTRNIFSKVATWKEFEEGDFLLELFKQINEELSKPKEYRKYGS